MLGKFITIEGIDGAGKSVTVDAIRGELVDAGISVILTREPGGTPIGESVRQLLLNANNSMGHHAETLLIFAARAQHIEEVILPSLTEGKWVICDRFTDSTYAYQGGGRKISFSQIGILENWVQGDLRPDLTLFLDADVETGKERLGEKSKHDRFESEYDATSDNFFARVREAYHELAHQQPQRIKVINSCQTPDQVKDDAISAIRTFVSSIGT